MSAHENGHIINFIWNKLVGKVVELETAEDDCMEEKLRGREVKLTAL